MKKTSNKRIMEVNFKGMKMNLNNDFISTIEDYYKARMQLVEVQEISRKNMKVYNENISRLSGLKRLDNHQKEQLAKDLKALAIEKEKVKVYRKKQEAIFKVCFEKLVPSYLAKAFDKEVNTYAKYLEKYFSDLGMPFTKTLKEVCTRIGYKSSSNKGRMDNHHITKISSKEYNIFMLDVLLQVAIDNKIIGKTNMDWIKDLEVDKIHALDNYLAEIVEIEKPKTLKEYKEVFKELGLAAPKQADKNGYAQAFAKYVRNINAVMVEK